MLCLGRRPEGTLQADAYLLSVEEQRVPRGTVNIIPNRARSVKYAFLASDQLPPKRAGLIFTPGPMVEATEQVRMY